MMTLASKVLEALRGKTLSTAESCTGGGIGAAITAVAGSSSVYKGGIVSYCNEIKHSLLDVDETLLTSAGAVSAPVAEAMARGARVKLNTDIAVSVTGLAGPGGDEYGNPLGTVFIGYADEKTVLSEHYVFKGSREEIRDQAIHAAFSAILKQNSEEAHSEKN